MKKYLNVIFSILTGLFIGFVNGFLGAGGGMLLVPLLMILTKGNTKKSHATAVFVILPIALVSGITYIIKNIVDWSIILPVGIGTLIGGLVGTFLLTKLKNDVINCIFYGVMIFAGVCMIVL